MIVALSIDPAVSANAARVGGDASTLTFVLPIADPQAALAVVKPIDPPAAIEPKASIVETSTSLKRVAQPDPATLPIIGPLYDAPSPAGLQREDDVEADVTVEFFGDDARIIFFAPTACPNSPVPPPPAATRPVTPAELLRATSPTDRGIEGVSSSPDAMAQQANRISPAGEDSFAPIVEEVGPPAVRMLLRQLNVGMVELSAAPVSPDAPIVFVQPAPRDRRVAAELAGSHGKATTTSVIVDSVRIRPGSKVLARDGGPVASPMLADAPPVGASPPTLKGMRDASDRAALEQSGSGQPAALGRYDFPAVSIAPEPSSARPPSASVTPQPHPSSLLPAAGFAVETLSLGAVGVEVTRRDRDAGDALHVHFAVDRNGTVDLIERASEGLNRALAATGTRLEAMTVELRAGTLGINPDIDPQVGGSGARGDDARRPAPAPSSYSPPSPRPSSVKAVVRDRFA